MADHVFNIADTISAGYSGAATTYEITFNGHIEIKAWGAGGGGGIVHSSIQTTGYRTAGGGYADGRIPVSIGDIIKIEVGQGGRRAETETTGSLGGWPDGGRGTQGPSGAGGNFYRGGGGGGSTRVYKNDVLVLVAGASGGGCRGYGGAGGGETAGTALSGGTGGTQIAGGTTGGASLDGADAPLAPANGSGCGGGGGGYFGGGYLNTSTNVTGGGGGSSYRNASIAAFGEVAQGTNSQAGTAAKNTDPDYVANVGRGGQTYAGPATTTHGDDGLVVMRFNDGAEYQLVQEEQTGIVASGASQEWTIPASGVFKADMWGAGGGGGLSTLVAGPYPRGGGGGHTYVEVPVQAGDVIRVDVGKGGLRGRQPNDPNGGGWPDGGHAGSNSSSSSACGSGGGSTRIFVNGTLVAVAGGGGGGGIPTRADKPGAGGGLTAQSSFDDASAVTAATGGSQVAGGINPEYPADTGYQGGYLLGGNGRPAGVAAATLDSRCAAGGGGGYYGGGGSGLAGSFFRAGAGGSGYVLGSLAGATNGGALGVPAGIAEANYPGSNIAYGGNGAGSSGSVQNGYDGYVSYYYEPLSYIAGSIGTVTRTDLIDGVATGAVNATPVIGTVTISPLLGIGDGGTIVDALQGPLVVTASVPVGVARVENGWEGPLPGPVTFIAPEGIADTQVNAFGSLPTVTILSLIEGAPEQEANIVLDLVFEFDGGVFVTEMPEASATGAADRSGLLGTVSVGAVNATFASEDQNVEITEPVVASFVPPEAYAAEAVASPSLPVAFTTESLLSATATGAAAISGRISFIPENGMGGGVGIGGVNGTPSTPPAEVSGNIGTIPVDPIQGVALSGNDVVLAVGVMPDRVTSEWTNTDALQATGGGNAFAQLNQSGSNNPGDNYLVRVWRNTNIDGSGNGSATVTADLTTVITFAAPQGVTIRGQNVLAPIGTIFLRRPLGGGGENPAMEGDALAGYDLRDVAIIITPPEAAVGIDGNALAAGQLTVVVLPPEASGVNGQDQAHDIPGPIVLVPPEGLGEGVAAESTADADLTAVVTLLPPEAQPVVSLAVMLPGAVRLIPVRSGFKVVAVSGKAVFIRQVEGEAVFRRVENAVAVVEDRVERTVILRG